MPELVYRPVIATALTVLRALDLTLDIQGAENIPRTGGAIVASNHISYLDFIIVGAAGLPSKRLVRFMAKQEIFAHWLAGPLMRGMHHISVDRSAGAASFNSGAPGAQGRRGRRRLPRGDHQPVVHRQAAQERRRPAARSTPRCR